MIGITLCALLAATPSYPDGSLVVLQNSNKPVAAFTRSAVTHVGLIGTLAGEPWVYEATPARVRRISFRNYQAELAKLNERRGKSARLWIMPPKQAYTPEQVTQLQKYMLSQLGRRYSVKGYVRGRKGDGVHCAEFASSALGATGVYRFPGEERWSPAQVVNFLRPHSQPPLPVTIEKSRTSAPWGAAMSDRWSAFRLWCGWACYELLTFCW